MTTKGIILAGGTGSRLYPLTRAVSKQLMAVYDKPMIYYPLCTLLMAGVRTVLIITTPEDQLCYQKLLGHGQQWGIDIHYAVQPSADGIAQALIIGRSFIGDAEVALILGDNIFHDAELEAMLTQVQRCTDGATVFACAVKDPQRYGVVEFDLQGQVRSICEKPLHPLSPYAVTGLYLYDNQCIELVKQLKPSTRAELEITDLNQLYLQQKQLQVVKLGPNATWLDAGTHDALLDAGNFVRLKEQQGQKIGCIEEVAWRCGCIDDQALEALAVGFGQTTYSEYLFKLLKTKARRACL